MAQIKKAKDALGEQIVDLLELRDYIRDCDFDVQVKEVLVERLSHVIVNNRIAHKSLI